MGGLIGVGLFGSGIDWSWFSKPERTWWEIVLGLAAVGAVLALLSRRKG